MIRKHLGSGDELEAFGRRFGADEFAAFSYDEELVANQRERGGAEIILFPTDFASFEFHATQAGAGLKAGVGASIDAIEKSVVIDAGGVMV